MWLQVTNTGGRRESREVTRARGPATVVECAKKEAGKTGGREMETNEAGVDREMEESKTKKKKKRRHWGGRGSEGREKEESVRGRRKEVEVELDFWRL